jgi:hypothetical protein
VNVRHRIPSIFNLSMVDVLCCALGCVILLWLFYLRLAKQHQDAAEEQHRETAALLDTTRGERDDAYALITNMSGRLHDLDQQRAGLRRQLADQQAAHAELESKWKASTASVMAMESDLRAGRKQIEMQMARIAELEEKLKGSAARVAALEGDVRAGDKRYDAQLARAADLLRQLEAAEAKRKDAQAAADLVPGLKSDLKEARSQYAAEAALSSALQKEIAKRMQELAAAGKELEAMRAGKRLLEGELSARDRELGKALAYKEMLARSEKRVQDLEEKLAEAIRHLGTVQDDRKHLAAEADRLRAAANNRFAGIELTGRRVVFLVDMSGSMELVDDKTPAPTKWREVGQTVARLMRSLPDLEKFQVVVFSMNAKYLLGGDGWLDYDPRSSADRVVRALGGIKPEGGTNMYAALQAAFHLRDQGLDTIYLLSDGLPNQGAGLPASEAEQAKLTEEQRNELCSRYIRRMLKTAWNASRPGQPRVRINAVGFFFESPDVGAFLWALARENDGSFVGMSKP